MVSLSKRQIKNADRIGGIELHILWPTALGPEPSMAAETEREATRQEKAYAESLVGNACDSARLVPVHTRVARTRRSRDMPVAPAEQRVHLAITIIGYRWVHAPTKSRGIIAFAAGGAE